MNYKFNKVGVGLKAWYVPFYQGIFFPAGSAMGEKCARSKTPRNSIRLNKNCEMSIFSIREFFLDTEVPC